MGKANKNEVKKIDFEQFRVLYCLKYVAIESKLQKLVFKYGENNYFLLKYPSILFLAFQFHKDLYSNLVL